MNYLQISAIQMIFSILSGLFFGKPTQNVFLIFAICALCLMIEMNFDFQVQLLWQIKLILTITINIIVSMHNNYFQIASVLITGFLIASMNAFLEISHIFTISFMAFHAIFHLVQNKYCKILSINCISLFSLLVVIDHKSFYTVCGYALIYQSIINKNIKFYAFQFNYGKIKENYKQNLKNIIQLQQSVHLATRHRMLNYLTLLLQQPINDVQQQIHKEIKQLIKLYYPSCKKVESYKLQQILKFIQENQYYIYSQIAKPTKYGFYIKQQQKLLQLNKDKQVIDKIQHLLLIDLIMDDIENTDIIIERNKKKPQESFEVFNEPQFIIPQAQINEGKKNVMQLVRNSSTGMMIEHNDESSSQAKTSQTSPTQANISKSVIDQINQKELENKSNTNLLMTTAENCFFANRYPSELNVQNFPNYYPLDDEQLQFKQQLDDTYQEWHKNVPTNQFSEYVCNQFESLNFNSVEFNNLTNNKPLIAITYLSVRKLKFDQMFSLNMNNFFAFLYKLETCYNYCLYHNKLHAADVVQCTYLLIAEDRKLQQQKEFFQQLDALALLLAAACHDFGHPGVDNPFLHKNSTKLHQVFPEVGPLEQIHAALSFNYILKYNFLEENLRLFRIKFVEFILTTDMTTHFQFVNKMKNISDEFILAYQDNQIQDADALSHLRWLRMKIIIKIADVSNPCRPFDIAQYWAYSFVNENRGIGSLHTPVMDAQDYTKHSIIGSQIGFINFVLKPFVDEIKRFCGNTQNMELQMHANMLDAFKRWSTRKEENWVP